MTNIGTSGYRVIGTSVAFLLSVALLPAALGAAGEARQGFFNRSSSAYDLAGTYRLSPSDSDDPQRSADRALSDLTATERRRVSTELEDRLTPPETLSIERNGDRVTIASSDGPRTTFDVQGRATTETGPGGERVTTRTTARGDELEVSTSGTVGNDFTVTFAPIDGGRSLFVTRRLFVSGVNDPVVVRSLYRRTSETPDWNVYDSASRRDVPERTSSWNDREIIVPTGTTFVATLDEALNTRTYRDGDRLSLTIQNGPSEFRDATIEGSVTSESTRASSSGNGLTIAFDRIRLRDGRSADFDGTIERVRDPDGRDIAFDRAERTDEERNDQAVKRGAIGAAVGAVIGAVFGGGKGAAIGAVLGGGAGAGTVLIDRLNGQTLPRGTEFTIRSTTTTIR